MIPDQLLANVAMHTHNPVVITDAGGATLWVNPAFEQLTGFAQSEMRGRKPGSMLQGPHTDPQAVQVMRQAIRDGRPVVGLELLNYDRAGHEYWVELDITPVRDAAGTLTHFIAIQTPVSARREAQQAIAALSKRLTIALGAAGLGVWDLSPGSGALVLDAAAVRVLGIAGVRPGEPVAWSALPAELARWRDASVQALVAGTEVDVEAWIGSEGSRRCLRMRGQRVGDGSQARVAGVLADETAARESQARAEALALQTMLDVERRDVLGRLRREFRLPLNSLLGFAQLARVDAERGGLGDLAGRIGQIESAGLQLLDMLDELLATSATAAGNGRATLQPVMLRDMLERHLPREVALAGREQIDPRLAVWADPTLLRRTMSLAGGLGLQAGASGSGPRLQVFADGDGPAQRVGLRFSYPPAAGTRASTERSLRTDLIGRLLADMGGSSELADTTDGLEFTLWLRAARGLDDGADDAGRTPAPDVWATRGDVGGDVLYVEDDPGNVAIVEHALRSRPGVRLRVAGDVASALDMLGAGPPPDLLLLDLTLPGASGRELLATLRADPRWAGLPCVVLTSINDIAEETALRTQGADDYLTKPLRLDRLLSVVDGYLQARGE